MKTTSTKVNKYEPTTAELKLLEVMLDPGNRLMNITDICHLAQISRKTYYDSFKKDEFVDLVHTSSLDLVKRYAIELVVIGIHFAREGSAQHWKVLMEMADLYKKHIDAEDTVEEVIVRFVDPDSYD